MDGEEVKETEVAQVTGQEGKVLESDLDAVEVVVDCIPYRWG